MRLQPFFDKSTLEMHSGKVLTRQPDIFQQKKKGAKEPGQTVFFLNAGGDHECLVNKFCLLNVLSFVFIMPCFLNFDSCLRDL